MIIELAIAAAVYTDANTNGVGNQPAKITIVREADKPAPKVEGVVVCGKYPVPTKDGIVDKVICEVR